MKISLGKNRRSGYMLLIAVLLYPMIYPGSSGGQDIQQPISSEPIKKDYKSWSLFLVCGPEWLLDEKQDQLLNLYHQFGAFGKAIGPKHLAVWFWKTKPGPDTALADYVDANRTSLYCAKFNLLPSESPHIVVTTEYPALNKPIKDYFVVKLNKSSSSDITALLTKLSDQLAVQGLNQASLDSEQSWRAWQRSFEAIKSGASSLFKKTKVTIDTKFFKIEIDGSAK